VNVRYVISGANSATGDDVCFTVEADDEAAARAKANARGVFVSAIAVKNSGTGPLKRLMGALWEALRVELLVFRAHWKGRKTNLAIAAMELDAGRASFGDCSAVDPLAQQYTAECTRLCDQITAINHPIERKPSGASLGRPHRSAKVQELSNKVSAAFENAIRHVNRWRLQRELVAVQRQLGKQILCATPVADDRLNELRTRRSKIIRIRDDIEIQLATLRKERLELKQILKVDPRLMLGGLTAVLLIGLSTLSLHFSGPNRKDRVPDFSGSQAGAIKTPVSDDTSDSPIATVSGTVAKSADQPHSTEDIKRLLSGTFNVPQDSSTDLSITFAYPRYSLNPSRSFVWAHGTEGSWDIIADHPILSAIQKADGWYVLNMARPDDPTILLTCEVKFGFGEDGGISSMMLASFMGKSFPSGTRLTMYKGVQSVLLPTPQDSAAGDTRKKETLPTPEEALRRLKEVDAELDHLPYMLYFTVIARLDDHSYEIQIAGSEQTELLNTSLTKFETSGRSNLVVTYVKYIDMKTNAGFTRKVRVLKEAASDTGAAPLTVDDVERVRAPVKLRVDHAEQVLAVALMETVQRQDTTDRYWQLRLTESLCKSVDPDATIHEQPENLPQSNWVGGDRGRVMTIIANALQIKGTEGSAVHYAIEGTNVELLQCLVEAGHDVSADSPNRGTPIQHLMRVYKWQVGQAKLVSGMDMTPEMQVRAPDQWSHNVNWFKNEVESMNKCAERVAAMLKILRDAGVTPSKQDEAELRAIGGDAQELAKKAEAYRL
jgi:hypothetical protein